MIEKILLSLAPEVAEISLNILREIKDGEGEKAALLAMEAAERQAVFSMGRAQLKDE